MFRYATARHVRRHGPAGYKDYKQFKPWLRDEFDYRCVYCLMRECWYPAGSDFFGADHAKSKRLRPDLRVDYENLFYACNRCNSVKGEARTMNPERHALGEHIRVEADGTVTPLTPAGERQRRLLELDDEEMVRFRRQMIETIEYVRRGLPRTQELLREWMGYPEDLPDLRLARPPAGNARPRGLADSAFARRERGALPDTY